MRFSKGSRSFYIRMILLLPVLGLHTLRVVSAETAKATVLRLFFGGMPLHDFQMVCEEFCAKKLPQFLRPQALIKIREHQALGHRVIVVSASAENWLLPWCRNMGLECLATRLEVRDNCITGRLATPNCNGMEKVRRVRELIRLESYSPIHAYGDTAGDKPMLALAEFAHFRIF